MPNKDIQNIENDTARHKLIFESGYHTFIKQADKDFVILQLTDLHFGRGILSLSADKKAKQAIIELVDRVQPDFIVITGDCVYPLPIFSGTRNNMRATKYVAELFGSFGIPWTVTLGNHDSEPLSKYNRKQIASFYSTAKGCLFSDDSDVYGNGNHMLKINNADGNINNVLAMLDSNEYLGKHFFSGFDNIRDDQIEWYKNTIEHIGGGKIVPSLAFFHMPPKEMRDAWEILKLGGTDQVKYHLGTIGEVNDHVGYSRKKQGNFFEQMYNFGSCKGMFFGHDHLSNLSITYRGIRLTYGMSIDYLAYPKIKKRYTQRGGTIIKIKDDGNFTVELCPLTVAVKE